MDVVLQCVVLQCVCVYCVTALDHSSEEVSQQVEKLKECISVLFGFHRRPTKDAEFVENTRKWTERLVSAPALCLLEITLHAECVYVCVYVCV